MVPTFLRFPVSLFAVLCLFASPLLAQDLSQRIASDLVPKLSPGTFISTQEPPRWSSYNDPDPIFVVNVRNEADVALTVLFANALNIPFLAQNGGNGWADTFHLGKKGIIINLANLNQFTVSADKKTATIGGGININNTIQAASTAGVLVETGNCNCVGLLGAFLGAGYGNLVGLYGLGIDNILSMRVVTAEGKIITASPGSNPDYFWAMRGAGPNFGIVTSATVKVYPASSADQLAWTGGLIFTPDKLEKVVEAIAGLDLASNGNMNVFMYFLSGGPPNNEPSLVVTPYLYKGTPETGRAAFASLYEVGPVQDNTAVVPYKEWNTAGDGFCTRGGRKPSFTAGTRAMKPDAWRKAWDLYVDFQKNPDAANTAILVECYSLGKTRSITTPAAFAHKDINFNAVVIPWYTDPSLDAKALEFGRKVRDIWRSQDGVATNGSYINFARGDEDLTEIYGESLPRLKALKRQLDPKNRFNQWFNIKP